VNIFHLVEEILLQRRNNALNTFSRYSEIEDWLREQWASLFHEFLKRTSQSEQITSLAAQITQLSELNKTFKTYLENLMSSIISPEKSKNIIETESHRLDELARRATLLNNIFFTRLLDVYLVPTDKAITTIREAKDLEEFFDKLEHNSPEQGAAEDARGVLAKFDDAMSYLNEARTILQRPPFAFDGLEKTADGRASKVDKAGHEPREVT
jgi:hypothetical protein